MIRQEWEMSEPFAVGWHGEKKVREKQKNGFGGKSDAEAMQSDVLRWEDGSRSKS